MRRSPAPLVRLLVALLLVAGLGTAPPAQAERGSRAPYVVDGRARFEVVTPSLVRMELAEDGRFEDRPTLTLGTRRHRAVAYRSFVEDGWRVIRTSAVELRWRRGGGFGPEDLVLRFRDGRREVEVSPQPGAELEHLGGWTRGLDLSDGPEPLNPGILTREGWFVLDDSATALLTRDEPGFAVRPEREGDYRDWYAFAYGRDYARALADLRTLTGSAPLPPRNAFGVWFSTYFAYTERGDFRGALRARTWDLSVRDVDRPRSVSVDGRRVRGWTWDGGTRVLRVVLDRVPSASGATVRLRG